MIDPQTIVVSVAACVVIAAVWAWGIIREDASTVRAHASGIELGRALERSAARGAMVRDTTTAANGPQSQSLPHTRPDSPFPAQSIDTAPSTLSAGGGAGQPRAIPDFLRNDGSRP